LYFAQSVELPVTTKDIEGFLVSIIDSQLVPHHNTFELDVFVQVNGFQKISTEPHALQFFEDQSNCALRLADVSCFSPFAKPNRRGEPSHSCLVVHQPPHYNLAGYKQQLFLEIAERLRQLVPTTRKVDYLEASGQVL
jgi:hypothetical protein